VQFHHNNPPSSGGGKPKSGKSTPLKNEASFDFNVSADEQLNSSSPYK
jgi:hypothetical protein